jgi:hypothetical protein
MGILGRVVNHVFFNLASSQFNGAKLGNKIMKEVGIDNQAGKLVGTLGGAFVGSVLAGVKVISPNAIIESASLSEDEAENRFDRIGWDRID